MVFLYKSSCRFFDLKDSARDCSSLVFVLCPLGTFEKAELFVLPRGLRGSRWRAHDLAHVAKFLYQSGIGTSSYLRGPTIPLHEECHPLG